ncbi:beta-glucosidase [Phenylobacterium sp. LjRoot225]
MTSSAAAALAPCALAADAGASVADARAERTLKQLTLDERFDLIRGYMPFLLPPAEQPKGVIFGAGYVKGAPRLGVPPLIESDASLGVANMASVMRRDDVATALPSGAAMAATWDPALVERAGAMIGAEARAKGFNVLLAGGVNLVREPRNGRNFEYLGEDPLLAGTLGGHAIRGVQSARIISTIKHFALNAQETGRMVLSANLDEAALRESDLLAFEIGVEIGQPGAVMCAYNQVNGVYACENSFLLNDVLRRDWGYKGFVMSDWGAVHSPSIRAGLDQQSGTQASDKPYFGAMLRAELAAGRVTEADIDQAARRILRTIYASGVADHPVKMGLPIDYAAHGEVAQAVAEAGIVLLKNDGGLLPIAASAKRILVVGAHADVGVVSGGGSSQVNPVGGAALALSPPGEPVWRKKLYAPSSPLLALREVLPQAAIAYDDGSDPQRAAAAARDADLVVVFAEQFTTEGKDVPDLNLPDNQDALITAVAAANPRTAVVLETGGPVLMPWLDKVGAVLEAWYPGQRGGQAIARILTGAANPSGRLAITFPATIEQTPNPKLPGADIAVGKSELDLYDLPDDRKHFPVGYPEGADVGYRWYDRTRARPLFAFGHGLSYTHFAYRDLAVSGGTGLRVAFQVANVGARAGTETAQVYARVNGVKRLVGWSRVDLKPGETRQVSVTADPRLLAAFDVKRRSWHVAAGVYTVEVSAAADRPILAGKARLAERRIRP